MSTNSGMNFKNGYSSIEMNNKVLEMIRNNEVPTNVESFIKNNMNTTVITDQKSNGINGITTLNKNEVTEEDYNILDCYYELDSIISAKNSSKLTNSKMTQTILSIYNNYIATNKYNYQQIGFIDSFKNLIGTFYNDIVSKKCILGMYNYETFIQEKNTLQFNDYFLKYANNTKLILNSGDIIVSFNKNVNNGVDQSYNINTTPVENLVICFVLSCKFINSKYQISGLIMNNIIETNKVKNKNIPEYLVDATSKIFANTTFILIPSED